VKIGEMNLNSIKPKEIRKFGAVAFVFFGILFALGLWKEKMVPIYLFGTLSVLGLGFVVAPAPLKPVYTAWLRTAHFIGKNITRLILILMYYLVITPSGLLKKLFGGAPLPRKPDAQVSTYWVQRSEPVQPRDRYIKRF
jgi:hypothetical protein